MVVYQEAKWRLRSSQSVTAHCGESRTKVKESPTNTCITCRHSFLIIYYEAIADEFIIITVNAVIKARRWRFL